MTSIKSLACAVLLGSAALPAQAAVFNFTFAFPGTGIGDVPGSTELASNQFVTTNVTVASPTRLGLYRLRQRNADSLPGYPAGTDVDLVLGGNRFEIDDQAFNFAGQLVANFTFSGQFINSLGFVHPEPGFGDVFDYYAFVPFRFYFDATAHFDGIGPFVGSSDIIYIQLPGDTGLYRLQAAVPEPAAWALMIGGFGMAGAALRLRRSARSATV